MIKKSLTIGLTTLSLMAFSSTFAHAKIKVGKSVAATAALTTASIALDKSDSSYTELMKKFSDEDLITLIKSEGYSAVTQIRDGAIRIKIEGRNYILYNGKRGNLQMYYGIGGVKISNEDLNNWNYSRKYSKAYFDKDHDIGLESDLEAEAGLTRQQALEFIKTFIISVSIFREYIREHDMS